MFEQGLVSVKGKDVERVAVVSAHEKGDYTEVRQSLDFVLRMLGVKYEIVPVAHDSFIPGRVGRVIVEGKKVAYIGEIDPKVLSNWELNVPVVGFELNLKYPFSNFN